MTYLKWFITVFLMILGADKVFAQSTAAMDQLYSEKEYVLNGGFENGVSKWFTYSDGAVAAPVDCTGGSSAITLTAPTASPIQGKASGLITKPASNAQGSGIATNIVLDKDAKTKIITIKGSYEIASGSYSGGTSSTDSDVVIYMYDVDGASIIQPASYKLDGGVANSTYQFTATFQSPHFTTDTRSMRLCAHVATTSASAYSLKLDRIKIGVQYKSQGAPVTDEMSQSGITISATSVAPTKPTGGNVLVDKILYRRVGSNLEADYEYTQNAGGTGTAGTGDYLYSLPSGLSLDSTKVTPFSGAVNSCSARDLQPAYIGEVHWGTNNGSNRGVGKAFAYDSTKFRVCIYDNSGSSQVYNVISSTFWSITNSGLAFKFRIKAPISGWGSTVTMSDSADGRVVAFNALASSYAVPASITAINNFNTLYTDTHGGGSASQYTVRVPGLYDISGVGTFAPASSTGGTGFLAIYINGTQVGATTGQALPTAGQNYPAVISLQGYKLNAGDVVTLRTNQNTGSTVSLNIHFSVVMRSGQTQVAASEAVFASYWLSATGTYSTTAPINFDSKELDSHSSVQTGSNWRFIAPINGVYMVSISDVYPNAAFTGYARLYKNGVDNRAISLIDNVNNLQAEASVLIQLNAGEYIDVRPAASTSIRGGALNSGSNVAKISIIKIN